MECATVPQQALLHGRMIRGHEAEKTLLAVAPPAKAVLFVKGNIARARSDLTLPQQTELPLAFSSP